MTLGTCAFCGDQAKLKESHVLPAFVYRWLRRRGTGHIRHSENPNRRVQDGLKLKLLCGDCERRFSRFETAFATKVFHPWHDGTHRISYENWLLKFCVSVSWRVLTYALAHGRGHDYTTEQQTLLRRADQRWRAFLNDEVPHPAEFEQHMLIFDFVKETTVRDLPSNFNRYMTGAVTLDIVGSDRSVMTFAKLGRFLIFGMIQKGPVKWEGTKIHVKDGLIKPDKFVVPAGLLDLFKEKAGIASDAIALMSPAQKAKVDANVMQNLDSFLESDHFAAIAADARMFGEEAVIRKK